MAIVDVSEVVDNNWPNPSSLRRKRRALMLFLGKLHLLMVRRRRSEKSKFSPLWKSLVGTIGLFQFSCIHSPPPSHEDAEGFSLTFTAATDNTNEMSSVLSYASLSTIETSDDDARSKYASIVNLQELDNNQVDPADENGGDKDEPAKEGSMDCEGDEMIDAKAEEFIAQFYQQMRMELSKQVNRRR